MGHLNIEILHAYPFRPRQLFCNGKATDITGPKNSAQIIIK